MGAARPTIKGWFDCDPPTATIKNNFVCVHRGYDHLGRPRHIPLHNKSARAVIDMLDRLMKSLGKKPLVPVSGPYGLDLTFIFPMPKEREKSFFLYKDTKPDLDNILTNIFEALRDNGYVTDDCVIASVTMRKFECTENNGIGFVLRPLRNDSDWLRDQQLLLTSQFGLAFRGPITQRTLNF